MNNNRINAILFSAAVLAFCCVGCSESKTTNERKSMMEPRISVITLGVADLPRSFLFYKEGLGFPTKMTPDGGIVLFATSGTRLFLYPYEKLAEDAGLKVSQNENKKEKFHGFTFGHCVRKKEDVDAILSQAEKAGGRIVKVAKDTSWGGYSGYFADPDGYLWEVAYSEQWKFNSDGSVAVEE
jgi:catechol 2,3-dioxygenase-like lactoylglutathione lyase family enzyme